jgi:predicted AAA+ superfamily ATPase
MDTRFTRLELLLSTLTVFSAAASSPVLASFRGLCKAVSARDIVKAADCYTGILRCLREAGTASLGEYLLDSVRYSNTLYAKALVTGLSDAAYDTAAARDIRILSEISTVDCSDVKRRLTEISGGAFEDIITALPEWEAGRVLDFDALCGFFRSHGDGVLAKFRALHWSAGTLTPITAPDPIRYERMIGYNWQRHAVYENTRALMDSRYAANVLLYGDSGTGKSATVKSMLNVAEFSDLSLIEVSKKSLGSLPGLMDELAWRPQKFILFIDDLSFEDGDDDFSYLKVLLEGSLGMRPKNVALYVTSNRRQLVKRYFSDRDEISGSETVEEKTSLADRFGLRIPFFSLNQEDYLTTAEALARQTGIDMDSETLRKAALQWALEHGARTPRTARRFADTLAAGRQDGVSC